ncbi:hypothetical protein GCM10009104_18000 [Marinobacterium maritimum]|uniref:Prepilin-type N-terminal cleavage/methylation domain-containing protein n=1 Tax=Marinobacterium maritimum TaxID=500162 RepID=A0ABP3TE87_9GAMM
MNRIRQCGFTLVELLIALVLTGLIMSLLFASLRISSRAWDSADRRQQEVAEQYQLQQLLRRLVGNAQGERIRVVDGGVQVAFRGRRDEVVFVAPRYASSSGSGLLWYRLKLSEATPERPQALVLQTLAFENERTVDWDRLFDPDPGVDDEGELLPEPEEHVLRLTGDAELSFSYRYFDSDNPGQTLDEWLDQGTLPLTVELSLEQQPESDEVPTRRADLLSSWEALIIAMQEYSYDIRSDGF